MSLPDDFDDTFIDALKDLIENVADYRDELAQAGQATAAVAVGKAHGQLLLAFEHINSAALMHDLADLDDDSTSKLQQITANMAAKTKDLDTQEATVTWLVNFVGALIGVIAAPSIGGVITLWNTWNAKP